MASKRSLETSFLLASSAALSSVLLAWWRSSERLSRECGLRLRVWDGAVSFSGSTESCWFMTDIFLFLFRYSMYGLGAWRELSVAADILRPKSLRVSTETFLPMSLTDLLCDGSRGVTSQVVFT